jgi:hypothetical protein
MQHFTIAPAWLESDELGAFAKSYWYTRQPSDAGILINEN